MRQVQLAAGQPQDQKFRLLTQKYTYGPKKQAGPPPPAEDDDYEVYCADCGLPHNDPRKEIGMPCRNKTHKHTPCKGCLVAERPKDVSANADAMDEDDEEQEEEYEQ